MTAIPRVYLADPDAEFRSMLARALRDAGVDVLEFASGEELETRALADKPDLILLASNQAEMEGRQILARLRDRFVSKHYPLVLITDRKQAPERLASSVTSVLADWKRLGVHNLPSVVTWLQTRGKTGHFEMEALGSRGSVVLHAGDIAQASWKELRGRDVLAFFAEEFPNVGFRFAERLESRPFAMIQAPPEGGTSVSANGARAVPPGGPDVESPPPVPRLPRTASERSKGEQHLEQARTALAGRRWHEVFLHLRLAERLSAPRDQVELLLGLAYLHSGDSRLAVQELRLACRLNPSNAEAAAALEEALAALTRSMHPVAPQDRVAETPRLPAPEVLETRPLASAGERMTAPAAAKDARAESAADGEARGVAGPTIAASPTAEARASTPGSLDAMEPPLLAAHLRREPPVLTRALRRAGTRADQPAPRTYVLPSASSSSAAAAGAALTASGGARAGAPEPTLLQESPRPLRFSADSAPRLTPRGATEPPDPGTASPALGSSWQTPLRGLRRVAAVLSMWIAALAPFVAAASLFHPETWFGDRETASPRERVSEAPAAGVAQRRDAGVETGASPVVPRGDAPAQRLEGSAGERRIPALDRPPAPGRVLDARRARMLIDRSSGELELVREWTSADDTPRRSILWVLVAASGRVEDVRLLRSSGAGSFDRRATEAVKSVVYQPALRDGTAVSAWVRQSVVQRAG